MEDSGFEHDPAAVCTLGVSASALRKAILSSRADPFVYILHHGRERAKETRNERLFRENVEFGWILIHWISNYPQIPSPDIDSLVGRAAVPRDRAHRSPENPSLPFARPIFRKRRRLPARGAVVWPRVLLSGYGCRVPPRDAAIWPRVPLSAPP